MSNEADVEQLLESFQKALDTLNNIGNVEALITKLDASKNRKLLKRVKHVVGEVHNKVGTVKERVSNAYKRVKIRSSSESEEFTAPNSIDKDTSDREEVLQDPLKNNGNGDRFSPILGRKEKSSKRSTRQTDRSQNNKDEENCALEMSDEQSKENTGEDNDIPLADKETALVAEEEMDKSCETGNISFGNIDNQDNVDNEENITYENNERGNEDSSSEEIIEGTPEKPANKISLSSLSLNKNRNKSKTDGGSGTLDASDTSIKEQLGNSIKDGDETKKNRTDKPKISEQKEKRAKNKNGDGEKEESNNEIETSGDVVENDETNKDARKSISNSEQAEERDKACKDVLGKKKDRVEKLQNKHENDKNKNKQRDYSDSEVEMEEISKNKRKEVKKSNRRGKEPNKDADVEKEKTNTDKGGKNSDIEKPERTDKTSKRLLDKKNKKKNQKEDIHLSDGDNRDEEKLRNASNSDEVEKVEETAKKSQEIDNCSDEEKKTNRKDADDSDEDNIVTIEDTPKKGSNDKNENDEDTDNTEFAEVSIKPEDKEYDVQPLLPKIKLVDISKLLAPNKKPLDVMTPSPKTKKSVTFDNSVIILSSSDEETPKKDPKNKGQSPLKSAMRKSGGKGHLDSDSDSKENNENLKNRKSTRRSKTDDKIVSDHPSDSDFEEGGRSRRLRNHNQSKLKDKFSKLAAKYDERKCKLTSRRLRNDDKRPSDKEDSNTGKKNKQNKSRNSDSEDDSENDSTNIKNRKRRRKKDLLETSSLSEHSDNSDNTDSDFVSSSNTRKKSSHNLKKAKVCFTEADKDDPKFKTEVYIRLPLFKCEELPDIYKKKKEIFEIKRLTKMDITRRTRSGRNGTSKSSADLDKPATKRIKLTLKLNRKKKGDVSDDEKSKPTTEENEAEKGDETENGKKDEAKDKNAEKKDKEDALDDINVLEMPDCGGTIDELAEACLEQIQDNSDKEKTDSEKSDNDRDDTTKKVDKKKKEHENEENKEPGEESAENKSSDTEKDKDEEHKINGLLSDSEEQNDRNEKDKEKDEDNESSDDGGNKKKKGKKWKNDKLLKQKIDSSDSEDDFTNYSKKKDKTNSELVRKAKKRMKKSVLISDSESDEEKDSDKKKKSKDSDSDNDYKADDKSSSESGSGSEKEEEESDKEGKKHARKRIKRVKDSSSDDDDKSTRKHIRKMIDRDSLSETTKKAEQVEKERKARIADKQKKYNQIFELKLDATVEKVVLDFDEATDKPLLSVSKKLVKQLKPHQVHGVKFMWDACFESMARLEKDKGSGCILAHCMGLGKTLQVITLVHTLLKNSDKTKVEKILVVCPVNTVLNWKSEFKKWVPKNDELEVYELVSCKTSSVNQERNYIVREWHENGGILIIGYNMFRTLSNPDNKTISKKLRESFQEGLVDPGPDLVVCDEGHLLKNEKTHLSISMNRIKTPRRIVLTGTPLQNNLKEYWCMVQFIKPNLLGTYKEYMNRFVNPITNGQYTDSTQHDIVIMRRRSHVLHKLLDGVVQRQDYSVLEPYLPPKYEYVLFLNLTEVQIKLYKHYMDNFARKGDGSNRTSFLFTDFQQLQRMCTHPRVLLDKSIEDKEKKELNDESESEGSLKDFIDDDESEAHSTSGSERSSGSESDSSIKSDGKKKKKQKKTYAATNTKRKRVTRAQAAQKRDNDDTSDSEVEVLEPKEWWQEYIDKEELDNINHSSKIFLLFEILKECEEIGDKVLVFSQSLYTLNCLEYFLQRIDEATQKGETEKVGGYSGSWSIGLDYFRLDGSSSCDNRANWCDHFNDPNNTRARLFLISTKAGGLGINLVAANRVIIFDVSWNPSHDIQSIYRVYRFGQTKPSYIYRFVTYGTMEMKIYERQVTKQAISKRVIDEQQIDRHYSQTDIQELYKADLEPTDRPIPLVPKDVLLGEMIQKYDKTIYKYHEHQSLLENKQDEELNEEERKAAWDEFENEKVVRKTTLTNFAEMSSNLAAFQNSLNFSPQLIQMALANIVRKDNPAWSEVQIRGILPALVTQLQLQMSENDFSMYTRVQQEIRVMQAIQAQRMRENYLKQYQLQQMLQKQQVTNQLMGNLNITPEELRLMQAAASQNYINHPQAARNNAGGSGDVIELND